MVTILSPTHTLKHTHRLAPLCGGCAGERDLFRVVSTQQCHSSRASIRAGVYCTDEKKGRWGGANVSLLCVWMADGGEDGDPARVQRWGVRYKIFMMEGIRPDLIRPPNG